MCDQGGTEACDIATVRITVDPVNDAPVAKKDLAVTEQNTTVDIDVPANDTDVEGNLDDTSVTITVTPANGSLDVDPVGLVTYTPDEDYTGDDTFTYQICDANKLCSTATVDVVVNATGSTAAAQDEIDSTDEDTAVTIQVLKNDDGEGALETRDVTDPTNGSVVIEANGRITYTPDADFYGSDSFTYLMCDKDGFCDIAEVNVAIDPVDDNPTPKDDLVVADGSVVINIESSDEAFQVSPTQLVFNADNWNVAQTVTVTGVDVPSGDPNVLHFEASSNRVDEIQGPLEIVGGVLTSDRALAEAVTMPRETNDYVPTGTLSAVDKLNNELTYLAEGIDDDLDEYADEGIMFVGVMDGASGDLRMIRRLSGYRFIENASGDDTQILTVDTEDMWDTWRDPDSFDPIADWPVAGEDFVAFFASPTLFVDEESQTDILNVYNDGSPSDDTANLTDTRIPGQEGSVTTADADTLTDSAASFPTADCVDGCLTGQYVGVLDADGLVTELRLIAENTATILTLDSPWDTVPAQNSDYRVYYADPTESKRLTGLGMGYPNDVKYDGITYKGLEEINIYLGYGSDTVNVYDTQAEAVTTVDGGRGDDTFNLENLTGDLTVNANIGMDTFNVQFDTTSTATVNLNGETNADTFNLLTNGAAPVIDLNLDGGTDDDYFDFSPDWGQIDSLQDSGGGDDTLDFRDVLDKLRVDIAASQVTATIGDVDVSLGIANSLTHDGNTIEFIKGGQDSDSFNFADGASLATGDSASTTAHIDGQGGTADLLNYIEYTTGVIVDLSSGIATGVNDGTVGSVSNIENVTGGDGDDSITGDDNVNVLRGSFGNDTLIGKSGNDYYMFLDGWDQDYVVEETGGGDDTINFYAYIGDTITFGPAP